MENTHPTTPAPATAGGSTDIQPAAPAFPPPSEAPPCFERHPGETSRAYSAFLTFFQLGHGRCLQTVAAKLDESLDTIKRWSSKFDWSNRIQTFNTGLLRQQTQATYDAQLQHAADWTRRLHHLREQEWATAQQLRVAAQCFLETFGDEEVRRMTLAQASRALRIASDISRGAITGIDLPPSPEAAISPIQQQMLDAIRRAYSQPAPNPEIKTAVKEI
jgi:hypothetical protein